MKKLSFVLCIICGLMAGCLTAERNVVNNALHSSFPKLDVQVAPEFEYLGNFKKTSFEKAVNKESRLRMKHDLYVFVVPEQHRVRKAVFVKFAKVETYFISDLFKQVGAQLDSGICKLGGKNYQYCTSLAYNLTSNETRNRLFEKGYTLPCGVMRGFARVYGGQRDTLSALFYFESIEGTGLPCDSWQKKDWLTDKHLRYLKGFQERAEDALLFN
jgi:hypothetical protein